MPSLSVRRIDEDLYEKLKARAAEHGVSMEEEVRRILERAVQAPSRLGEFALECFGPQRGVELKIPRKPAHEPIDFSRK